ncbi:ATP-binding protein [Candidatus Woesearchaeota archaeon]|nr:ATP-binding protein [Candidatus Woesearchaeota archaeon]
MINDKYSALSGRDEDVKKLRRIAAKFINVVISGIEKVGKSFVARRTREAFVNAKSCDSKIVSVKAQGNKRDYEQIACVMSVKYKDIRDDLGNVQSFSECSKASIPVLERRILAGVKNSDKPYIIFIEELKKLPEAMRIFLSALLKTGKVSIVAEAKELKDSKTRSFYQGFDKFVVSPVSDSKMSSVYDEIVKDSSVKIDEKDYSEIKQKILSEVRGNVGRLKEIIDRSGRERSLKREDILEKFVNAFRNEYSVGFSVMFVVVFFMAYRFFLRGLGTVTDMVCGGVIFAFAILLYRLSSKFK